MKFVWQKCCGVPSMHSHASWKKKMSLLSVTICTFIKQGSLLLRIRERTVVSAPWAPSWSQLKTTCCFSVASEHPSIPLAAPIPWNSRLQSKTVERNHLLGLNMALRWQRQTTFPAHQTMVCLARCSSQGFRRFCFFRRSVMDDARFACAAVRWMSKLASRLVRSTRRLFGPCRGNSPTTGSILVA